MSFLRASAILTAFVLMIPLCSCDMLSQYIPAIETSEPELQNTDLPITGQGIGYHDDSEGYHIVNRYDFSYKTDYEPKRNLHSFETLKTDEARELYDIFLDACYCFSDDNGSYDGEYAMRPIILDSSPSYKDIESALVAVLDDHPEIFWMTTDFDRQYIRLGQIGLTFSSNYSAFEVIDMMKELDKAFSGFFRELPSGLSEYEREEYIYKYIINSCRYDEDLNSSDDYGETHPSIYDLYGVMIDSTAVCEGYSRAFDYLCSEVGVDSVCICGLSLSDDEDDEDGLHMWNAVQLDDAWYWVDCTWDDWDSDEDLGDMFYYLNITDEILLVDHALDKTYDQITEEECYGLESYINSFLPDPCSATEYCYYLREGIVMAYPDEYKLSEGFVEAAEKGRDSLLIVVDNDDYTPDSFADALFDGYQPYYQAIEIANRELSGVRLDEEADGVYYVDPDRNLLVFEMNYE